MENKGRNICRLCLKYCKNSFEPVEELIQEILNSLWIHLDISVSNKPVMCNNCSNKLKRFIKFKTEYLCVQLRALTFIKHKDDLKADLPVTCLDNKIQNNTIHFLFEHGLCSFCMNAAKCTSFKELEIQNVKIVELLQKYFPEMDEDITEQPTICNPCCDCLQSHYSFLSDCLSVEKTIREYCDIMGANFKEQVDLNSVLGYKSKNVTETCKKEEIFCEPPKGFDVNVEIKQENVITEAYFKRQDDLNNVLGSRSKNATETCKKEEIFCESGLDINVEIKQENFMNGEEYKLDVKPEYVFIKMEENLYDSIQESDLLKSEPNTWEIDGEIPEAAVSRQSEIGAIEMTYGNNSNLENVSEMIEKIYKCHVCSYQTSYENDFQGHALTHKNTSETTVYKCGMCDYKSTLKDYVIKHMTVHKSIHKTTSEVIAYNCELCAYKANRKQDLKKHMHHHKNILAYKSVVNSLETSKYNFQNHMLPHEGSSEVTTYKCEICDYETLVRDYITRHMSSHIRGPKVTVTSSTPVIKMETASSIAENGSQLVEDKSSQRMNQLSSWIGEYEEELCVLNDREIMCNICSKVVQVKRKHHITQHVEGKSHLMKLSSNPWDNFNEELCQTLLAANIPLQKIDNPVLRKFLEKYACRMIPAGSTLRKYCVGNIYNKIMDTIRKNISNNYLWISVDETMDPLGRCVVNVVVGTLRPHGPSDSYLAATKIIETVAPENIAMVINSSLYDLCINNDKDRGKVLLFLTDAAACMLETGKLLKTVYPNLLHITCTAHALHRVCKFIRSEFKTVDTLISTFKQNFRKAPLRSLYKNICPLPLPPAPVTSRWETWIEAALFYSKNLETLKEVINCLDNDVHPITGCKNIIKKPVLFLDLKYIDNNFSCLPEHIKYFETRDIPLKERLSKLESIIAHLKSIPKEFGHRLKQKVEAIYAENPDISILYLICSENFENQQTQLKYQHLSPYFKYAPLTSCDVKRTISRFMDVLDPKRSSLTTTNLERHLIINANSKVVWNTNVEESSKIK